VTGLVPFLDHTCLELVPICDHKWFWTTWSREKSGEQGVAGFPEILAKLVHDSLKKIYFMKFLTNWRAQRGKFFKYIFDFS
jgi:hypothetical protein